MALLLLHYDSRPTHYLQCASLLPDSMIVDIASVTHVNNTPGGSLSGQSMRMKRTVRGGV